MGLHDILGKWEQANDYVLKKYPEGAEMDFTLLEKGAEQAQLDVSVQEEKEARAAGRKKSRKPIIGHERDDQMQIYLQEIRYK